MKQSKFFIGNIPVLVCGGDSEKAFLFVHGLCGSKEEAIRFAAVAEKHGYQTFSLDLPGHGGRKDESKLVPWDVIPEIRRVYEFMRRRYKAISLRAISIGAYFSLSALSGERISECLLSSPLCDMVDMIGGMMAMAGVDEAELEEKGEIPTASGQTLSWRYLLWARGHEVHVPCHTEILYGSRDELIRRGVIDRFVENEDCGLTVIDSEHWIHTPEAVAEMEKWEEKTLEAADNS